ncbi:MAG: MogA/MoaB family molybdenum cofactor biosynthesis protein [Bacillota bacterium]|nr:MogA/MoaB family molybdenum cofactor biosynthesis protein [Bacillota bacterium]
MYKVAILTISDKGAAGEREDKSGPEIARIITEHGWRTALMRVIPDEREQIAAALVEICDGGLAELILTTGGTGFSPRDVTPEATCDAAERMAPGIAEAMRANSLTITDRAMLSRAVAAIRGGTLIVNLPGSPKAVRESLGYIIGALDHGLDILTGADSECAAAQPS